MDRKPKWPLGALALGIPRRNNQRWRMCAPVQSQGALVKGARSTADTMSVLGRGVYTIAEAARLTKLRSERARQWFRGREVENRIVKPFFQSDYPILDEEYAISFLDLIELYIGGKLREAGISLQKLRTVYHELRRDYGDHPFCTREIYYGGKQIFTRGLNDEDGSSVIEAISRQHYFDKIILPFLEKIEYDKATSLASRWHIAPGVVIDPRIRFGKPVVDETGISTTVLKQAFYANGEDAARVASWFGVEAKSVLAAVDFENQLAA